MAASSGIGNGNSELLVATSWGRSCCSAPSGRTAGVRSVLGPAEPIGVVDLVQASPGGQPADLQQLPQVVLFGPIGVVTTYSVSPSSLSISLPVMLFTSATVTTLSVGLVSSSVPVRHVELPGWNHHDIRSSGEGEQGAEAGRIRDVPTARSG